ncbi:MAG: GNAT family N-acetyltransferase [Saprospiraceae bacterium]|nr:GNAT family N-acetyltransferase [Saprospiraceae bacterium]
MPFLPYQTKHLEACLAIYDSNTPKYFSVQEREEFFEWLHEKVGGDNPYWVLEVDGEILGCGGIYTSKTHHTTSIYGEEVGFAWGMVHNDLHKKGFGKSLFLYRLEYLKYHFPNTPIILRTTQNTYTFFAKYGFETLYYTPNGFDDGLDKYEMIYRDPTKAKLETGRFRLREAETHDGQHFYELNNNPKVLQYLLMEPYENKDGGEKYAQGLIHQYKKYGIGRYLVVEKTTGDVLGWCGLKWLKEEGCPDIGWRLKESAWGKGIATETAKACLKYGHEKLGYKRIVAHALVDNVASVRVMEKIGMTYHKNGEYQGHPIVEYESVIKL